VSKDTEGKLTCKPIFSRIMSLFAEQNDLNYAVPGGLIGALLLAQVSLEIRDYVIMLYYIVVTCDC